MNPRTVAFRHCRLVEHMLQCVRLHCWKFSTPADALWTFLENSALPWLKGNIVLVTKLMDRNGWKDLSRIGQKKFVDNVTHVSLVISELSGWASVLHIVRCCFITSPKLLAVACWSGEQVQFSAHALKSAWL